MHIPKLMCLEINLYGIVFYHYNSDSLSFWIKFNHQKCFNTQAILPKRHMVSSLKNILKTYIHLTRPTIQDTTMFQPQLE